MGVQGRFKGVEGICRRARGIWEYKGGTREWRVLLALEYTRVLGAVP